MEPLERATQFVRAYVEQQREAFLGHARAIWSHPELGCEEVRASRLLVEVLREHGFAVETGVAGMPTAFVARWGEGRPVVAFSCEYDALPGLSQARPDLGAGPAQAPVVAAAPGHGCGHNLLGVGNVLAAVAVRRWLEAERRPGAVVVFGTPAEEICVGKPYMARAGAFRGVDAVLDWHPWDANSANADHCNAYFNVKYHFHGRTAHGNSPWTGRSALDSAVLMGHAIEMLREHVAPGPVGAASTINYTFSDVGPEYPSVVSDRATLWVVGRLADSAVLRDVLQRVTRCAEGAALATGTTWEMEFKTASHEKIPNRTLSAVLHRHLSALGAPAFDEREQAYARGVQRQVGAEELGLAREILPLAEGSSGLTDNSEYTWFAPFAMLWLAAAPAGTAWHSWIVTGCAGSSIGEKALLRAAEVLAGAGVELFLSPAILEEAKAEMAGRLRGRPYLPLIPDGVEAPIGVNRATMERFRPLMDQADAR